MSKSPAFQFYTADFLSDAKVMLMSNQAVGCYIKLLCFCWQEGTLPSNTKKLAKLCGEDSRIMVKLWQEIKSCFVVSAENTSQLIHPRLELERQKQAQFREERSQSGKKGAIQRWQEASSKPEVNKTQRLNTRTQSKSSGAQPSPSLTESVAPLSTPCSEQPIHTMAELITQPIAEPLAEPMAKNGFSSSSSSPSPSSNIRDLSKDNIDIPLCSLYPSLSKVSQKKFAKSIVIIFNYWKTTMDHTQAKLDEKRAQLICHALKLGYSENELCEAIQGCSLTPHNRGENERGQRYDGLHVILRSADQIDRFIRNCRSPPQLPKSPAMTELFPTRNNRIFDDDFDNKQYTPTPALEDIAWLNDSG